MQNVTIKFMSNKKTYWKGVAQLENKEFANEIASNEFSEHLPVSDFLKEKKTLEESSTSRRDFLKFMGFTTAAATLAACETPVVKSVPYLIKPDEIIPGVPNFYATTIYDGRDYASVLVKTREGRPIKIEANQSSTSARSQATILSFYDSNRAKEPMFGGKSISWSKLDKQIKLFGDESVGLVYGNYWRYNESGFFKKKKLASKKALPNGKIIDTLLKEYSVGILTVVIKKQFIKNKKAIFDTNFDMLSDMDFILKFSKDHKFSCVQEPVAIYRQHENQLQVNQNPLLTYIFLKIF